MHNCIVLDNTRMDYYVGYGGLFSSKQTEATKLSKRRAKRIIRSLCKRYNHSLYFYTIIHLKIK